MNTLINRSSVSMDTILKSKEIYHTAFDMSSSPQAIVSLDRRVMRANRAFSRVTGYTEIDLMSLTLQDILIANDQENADTRAQDLDLGAGCQIEADYIRKNGTIRRGRFWFHLMKDRDTGPVCWVLIMEDLTASRAADDAIRDYNQLFNHFISSSGDSIIFLDDEGNILYMNKTALRQMGVSGMDDAIHIKFADFWKGIEKAAADMAVKLAVMGMGGAFQGSIKGPASVESTWWEVTITPIAGESDKVERLMVVSRDITDQKKMEQLMDEMRKSMEQLDRNAARELDEEEKRHGAEKERLLQALAKAETLVREKETLFTEIHHRVKNNMQAVSCLINLQSSRIGDPEIAGMLRGCSERICSMSKVHEKLSTSDNPAHIDFHEYIEELAAELLHSSGKKGQVSIRTDVDRIFLGIREAVPCGLMITEIVGNAMKYAFPEGREGVITISLKRSRRGVNTLTVRDNGIGLPVGVNFETATTLGMELVSELTKQIKGSVSVVSDGGTAYTIRFKGDDLSESV